MRLSAVSSFTTHNQSAFKLNNANANNHPSYRTHNIRTHALTFSQLASLAHNLAHLSHLNASKWSNLNLFILLLLVVVVYCVLHTSTGKWKWGRCCIYGNEMEPCFMPHQSFSFPSARKECLKGFKHRFLWILSYNHYFLARFFCIEF